MNYFELFGLTPNFDIDEKHIADVFQSLQKSMHPDKFAHASSQEQLLAVQKSSMINDAYQTLKTPLARAQYMLELRGVDMPDEQSTFKDTSFLMRQMELREMLDDVKHAEDPDDAIFAASQELDSEYQSLFVELQNHLARNSEESDAEAAQNLRKLKFYQKLQVELDRIEDQLFDL